MLARMMRDPRGQQLTTALTDRLYRSRDDARSVDEVAYLLRLLGAPHFMRVHERLSLVTVGALAPLGVAPLTRLMARAIARRVRSEARDVLLDADDSALAAHLRQRQRAGVRVNVNQLGEALLGEREAEQRVLKYCALAERRDLAALSVKVSSIASQLNLLAFDTTLDVICRRLAQIYRATLRTSAMPAREQTVVMLDMEAYAHVELTLSALFRTLEDPSLDRVHAGVVLQAYLPDAHALLPRLQAYAAQRVARGGAPLRVRIVKGANLAHERVESEKSGATLPVFGSKREVDASYKRLLEQALTKASTASLQVGVASHNLFDLSYALLLRAETELEDKVELELLEGMAEPVLRALSSLGVRTLVYAPICRDEELNSGIAYLVRRLDENTAPENYLRASFAMMAKPHARPRGRAATGAGGELESEGLARERARFMAAIERVPGLDTRPRRAHDPGFDRSVIEPRVPRHAFEGEADTDFGEAKNRRWIGAALAEMQARDPELVYSSIAGQRWQAGTLRDGVDPSRPGIVPYRVSLSDAAGIERALDCAARDPSGYAQRSLEERAHLLSRCAAALRAARAELIATMVLDAGKRVAEADVEVSEAIDFAEYYRASFMRLLREEPLSATARGTVLVTPPWNFPLAIPAGGVFAALMAGCRVLFKPALETALVGARLASVLYDAGVPREALQLVLCDDEIGSRLLADPRVDSVILTGATETARLFQRLSPGLYLLAETGGKNAYIVSAMSDRELAIRDLVHSAFGHAGQKCSAASLLICEAEVYDDEDFRNTLRDAVESLSVGSSWAPESFVTPLIHPPAGALARAVHSLEPGERWLVEPRVDAHNPRLLHPGVKLGVRPGSFSHMTELFGPVLGVMRASSVAHAVELANATGYGLTAGLASLDEREQQYFSEHMRAGNLYINRTITGAIVQRQPFGGVGKSGFGPGAKAGGPNYVAQLCHLAQIGTGRPHPGALSSLLEARVRALEGALSAADAAVLRAHVHDYARAYADHVSVEHDPAQLLGQHNRFRYRPCRDVLLRVESTARPLDVALSCAAAAVVGARLQVSLDPRFAQAHEHTLPQGRGYDDSAVLGYPLTVETLEQLLTRAPTVSRMRLLGTRAALHARFNAELGTHIADAPVLGLGRIELLHYVTEQSISHEYHRYGHVAQPAK